MHKFTNQLRCKGWVQSLILFLFQIAWVKDSDGDPGIRLWGFLNFIFYKWDDSATVTLSRSYERVGKRGILISGKKDMRNFGLKLFQYIDGRERQGDRHESNLKDKMILVREDVKNDMHKDRLPTIPAGSEIIMDFGGDFGMYGVTTVNGEIHKIKVELHEMHKLDWRPYAEQIENFVQEPYREQSRSRCDCMGGY